MENHYADLDAVMRALSDYVQQHPAAADTELGITQWWLAGYGLSACPELVVKALEQLAQQGVMERVELGAGRRVWRARHIAEGMQ